VRRMKRFDGYRLKKMERETRIDGVLLVCVMSLVIFGFILLMITI